MRSEPRNLVHAVTAPAAQAANQGRVKHMDHQAQLLFKLLCEVQASDGPHRFQHECQICTTALYVRLEHESEDEDRLLQVDANSALEPTHQSRLGPEVSILVGRALQCLRDKGPERRDASTPKLRRGQD